MNLFGQKSNYVYYKNKTRNPFPRKRINQLNFAKNVLLLKFYCINLFVFKYFSYVGSKSINDFEIE